MEGIKKNDYVLSKENSSLIELMRLQNDNLMKDNASKNKIIQLLIENQHFLNKSAYENNSVAFNSNIKKNSEINRDIPDTSTGKRYNDLHNTYDSDSSSDLSSTPSVVDTSSDEDEIHMREVNIKKKIIAPKKEKLQKAKNKSIHGNTM